MDLRGTGTALSAFAATRFRMRTLRTRAALEAYQQHRIARYLLWLTQNIPFYWDYKGADLSGLPIIAKQEMLEKFADLNIARLSADAAFNLARNGLAHANTSGHHDGLTIGMSTGTSGNRGLFIISDRERHVWLGAILAKALPDAPWRRHRIALLLGSNNELYSAAQKGRWLKFAFFDLRDGVETHRAELERFDPTVLIAPPHALRTLAESNGSLGPRFLFSGGEVLDPLDAAAIETGLQKKPGQIYQATEGFFGVTCPHGTLHLNEDFVHVELEPLDAAANRYTPVVTDFTRRTQAMVRYRMNDILVVADQPCPCGSPMRAIRHIEGRCDDIFRLPAAAGSGTASVLPDVIRNAILDAAPDLRDFRAVQTGPAQVQLVLPVGTSPKMGDAIACGLHAALRRAGAMPATIETATGIPPQPAKKLRRVERRWRETQ